MSDFSINKPPRWRGFNLLEMFSASEYGEFREDDFRWIRDWGFDFVRIPISYRLWTDGDWRKVNESRLEKIDRVVELGAKYDLHVCLNFHRAPGYCVNPDPPEPFNLWKDPEALDAFCNHWQLFARRYRGVAPAKLSFNLINEPGFLDEKTMTRQDHERVIRAAAGAIREVDSERMFIIDGFECGNRPFSELADTGAAQSCRFYYPYGLSHYHAPWTVDWLDPATVPLPTWPGAWHFGDQKWSRRDLEQLYQPWIDLAGQGVFVHCGEGGAYNLTPHAVVLAWLTDVLDIFKQNNIGWAMWNFRGDFGILDSGRKDVDYQNWHGHQLDARLLDLLRGCEKK